MTIPDCGCWEKIEIPPKSRWNGVRTCVIEQEPEYRVWKHHDYWEKDAPIKWRKKYTFCPYCGKEAKEEK